MKRLKSSKPYFYLLVALGILALFAFMTKMTPLAGDDWGYALNGMTGHPFKSALGMYQTWSGRFFSEFWGFVIAPRKWAWNIINPCLFASAFVYAFKIANIKKKHILAPLMLAAIMLSVDDNLRMETYTWIMGTTYVVPLVLSLLYFWFVDRFTEKDNIEKKDKVLAVLVNIPLFIIGLMMENIAGTMVGGILILIIYCWFTNRKVVKYLVLNFAVSTVSFVIMRLSPGSAARLAGSSWSNLSLLEQISINYPNFLQLTFIANDYMVFFYSSVMVGLMMFTKKKVNLVYKVVSVLINALAVFSVFSFVLIKENNMFTDANSLFSMLFWPIYIVNAMASLWFGIEDEKARDKAVFLLVIGGAASIAMLLSPIYGSRSSLYTVYYIAALTIFVFDQYDIDKAYIVAMLCVCGFVLFDRTGEYIHKYKEVGRVNDLRMEIIHYYQGHPEDKSVWIPRYPIYSIHGADVEVGDTYHFETFKEYYHLSQSADEIYFYFLDEYY